jgi:hypothetical protein
MSQTCVKVAACGEHGYDTLGFPKGGQYVGHIKH